MNLDPGRNPVRRRRRQPRARPHRPDTAEVTASSADQLELARGGTAFAAFKATGTRLVPLA